MDGVALVVGAHIRRGHKYIEIPPAPPEHLNAPLLAILSSALSISTPPSATPPNASTLTHLITRRIAAAPSSRRQWASILVASEDNAAIRQVEGLAESVGARVAVVDRDHPRPNLRVSIPMACRLGLLDSHRENLVSLISLFLLVRHSDALVASFSSGYSRLIMELSLVSRSYRMPHHSLDVPFHV